MTLEAVVTSPRLERDAEGRALLDDVRAIGTPCFETADTVLESVQDARSPQPAVAIVRRISWREDCEFEHFERAPLIVVACAIQDPGNLGALVRTACAAGATGFYACGDGADLHHPRVVRATMGALFRIATRQTSEPALREKLRTWNLRSVAADPCGPSDYRDSELRDGVALLFGNEGGGLAAPLLDSVDERVRIPLSNGVESLSVAAAAAVLLFEVARQRSYPPRRQLSDV
jgi:TrmH family RNA methyltransferase